MMDLGIPISSDVRLNDYVGLTGNFARIMILCFSLPTITLLRFFSLFFTLPVSLNLFNNIPTQHATH